MSSPRSACVPTDVNSLTVEGYQDFLAARRVALADCMNAFIARKRDLMVRSSPFSRRNFPMSMISP